MRILSCQDDEPKKERCCKVEKTLEYLMDIAIKIVHILFTNHIMFINKNIKAYKSKEKPSDVTQ